MVKQFILMLLLCGVSSCYPPRMVYALDEMHSIKNNSIDYKKGGSSDISSDKVNIK